MDKQKDDDAAERGLGVEHLDLVLRGEEEHPLLSRFFNLEIVDDRGDAA